MPFVIEKNGPDDKPFCVYTQAEDGGPKGDTHGCHPTRDKAVEQLRALYSNVADARKQYAIEQPLVPRLDAPVYSIEMQEGKHCVTRADGSTVKCHPTLAEAEAHMAQLCGKGYIPQAERDRMPAEDFGDPEKRLFPIRNQQDVTDAAHLIGRADNPDAVKRRIIAIAKRKGFQIPDAWQAGKATETQMEVKSYDSATSVADADQGVVHAVVSVFGNVDADGDRVIPGAFKRTIERARAKGKFPPGVWSHDWKTPVAKTLDMYEDTDGLHVIGQFNLETQAGKDTFSNIKHGIIDEYSFGFTDARREAKDGAANITDLLMFEWSPTLIGSNRETRTIGVKAGNGESAMHPRSLADSTEEAAAAFLATKERIADLAGAWQAIALKEGRVLATARRQRLSEAHDTMRQYLLSLGQSLDLIAELLTETDPSQSARDEMQRQILRLQASTARANGVTLG